MWVNGPLADINVEKPREAQISTYEVPSPPHIHRTYKSFRTMKPLIRVNASMVCHSQVVLLILTYHSSLLVSNHFQAGITWMDFPFSSMVDSSSFVMSRSFCVGKMSA